MTITQKICCLLINTKDTEEKINPTLFFKTPSNGFCLLVNKNKYKSKKLKINLFSSQDSLQERQGPCSGHNHTQVISALILCQVCLWWFIIAFKFVTGWIQNSLTWQDQRDRWRDLHVLLGGCKKDSQQIWGTLLQGNCWGHFVDRGADANDQDVDWHNEMTWVANIHLDYRARRPCVAQCFFLMVTTNHKQKNYFGKEKVPK